MLGTDVADRITAYTKWEDMACYYSRVIETLPKVTKFTIGETVLTSIFREGADLMQADTCRDRVRRRNILDDADRCNAALTAAARLLCRRKIIDEHKYGIIAGYLVEVGKLTGALIKCA